MEFKEFFSEIFKAYRQIDPEFSFGSKVKVQIQGSSNFVITPLDDETGKTINIIRID